MKTQKPEVRRAKNPWALFAMVLLIGACSSSSAPEIQIEGTWLGTLTVDGPSLRIVVNLTRGTSGAYSGTMDSPDQGSLAIPIDEVTFDGHHVVATMAALSARFSGEVSSDDASIVGTFSQAGQSLALLLRKQPGPLDYRRPQDPIAPYPYRSQEVTFPNAKAGITLAGTLTWPAGQGPCKAVVLISGSGPNTRNEELVNHRPFLVLSDALTRAGLVTLRYDKRGVGQSTGDYAAATSMDFAADAASAVEFLRTQAYAGISSIGLIGHSEGGVLAPMAAEGNAAVAFLVLLAGPGVTGDQVLISQHHAIGLADGQPASELDAYEAIERRLFDLIAASSDPETLNEQMRTVLTAEGVIGKAQDETVAGMLTPWMRFFITYDPAPVLRRTLIPVLALNGSLDLQVLADLNLPPIEQALRAAGNTRATVRNLPGLNHLFQHATTGSPNEYGSITETLSPDVLAQISSWILAL